MADLQERFLVRMEGTRPIRLPVAEMTSGEALAAVEFLEHELQLMQAAAAPALVLPQRVTNDDRSTPRWELHRAREMVATLVRVQQQTARLRAAVRVVLPASSTQRQGENIHPKPMMMSRTTPSETKGIIVSLS
jgi:hypothetical protein